jgi:membrane associated rhomboid family serine protease
MRLPPTRGTIAIVVVTAVAWLAAHSAGLDDQVVTLAGFIPARLSGHLDVPNAVPPWLTPLSATLVHAGIVHLAFNLLVIGYCGRLVEASIGTASLVLLYVLGAYAAAGAEYLAMPDAAIPMVGASGAGSAIIGAFALLYGRNKVRNWGPIPGMWIHIAWLAVAWIALQALIGFASGGMPGVPANGIVATPAHVGGFLMGLLLARPLLLFRYRSA